MNSWPFWVGAVAVPLLLVELGGWATWLARRLVRRAARRLGDPDTAARYAEEFTAVLARVPGKLTPARPRRISVMLAKAQPRQRPVVGWAGTELDLWGDGTATASSTHPNRLVCPSTPLEKPSDRFIASRRG